MNEVEDPSTMTRRHFLTAMGTLVGGGVIVGVGGPVWKYFSEMSSYPSLDVEKKFNINGAQDFLPAYLAFMKFKSVYPRGFIYGDVNSYTEDKAGWDPWMFMIVMNNMSLDKLDAPFSSSQGFERKQFLEGWAPKRHLRANKIEERRDINHAEMVKQAVEYSRVVEVISSDQKGGDDPKVREYLGILAKIVPGEFLNGVKTIELISGGGTYNSSGNIIQIPDPRTNTLDSFLVASIHETSHAASNFLKGVSPVNAKQYVFLSDYTEYLRVQAVVMKDLADAYFSLPWERAKSFANGNVMVPLYEDWLASDESLKAYEDALASYGITFDSKLLSENKIEQRNLRYNRAIHAVGRKFWEINRDKSHEKDKAFLEDIGKIPYLQSLFFREISHYLVGPVQRKEGGLAGKGENVPLEDIRNKADVDLMRARMRAYGGLKSSSLNLPDLDFLQAIRDLAGV